MDHAISKPVFENCGVAPFEGSACEERAIGGNLDFESEYEHEELMDGAFVRKDVSIAELKLHDMQIQHSESVCFDGHVMGKGIFACSGNFIKALPVFLFVVIFLNSEIYP